MIIAIDEGHGYGDSGAVHFNYREDLVVREIGKRLRSILEERRHKVIIASIDGGLSSRARFANSEKADIYVAIHMNSNSGNPGSGTEVYYYGNNPKTKELAQKVQSSIVELGYRDRGIKTAGFVVLKETIMPAILVECCFLNNIDDMNKLNYDSMARAIADGIDPKPQQPQGSNPIYRIYMDGVQQGTAYSNHDNIKNILSDCLKKNPQCIEIKRK